jgi:hypothetical protein
MSANVFGSKIFTADDPPSSAWLSTRSWLQTAFKLAPCWAVETGCVQFLVALDWVCIVRKSNDRCGGHFATHYGFNRWLDIHRRTRESVSAVFERK